MATLENARHERFTQYLAKGMSATTAYVQAGYRPNGPNAARLTKNDDIVKRLAELQNRTAARAVTTVDGIAQQLDEDRKAAKANGQASAMVSATMGKAKVLGLIVDKHLVGMKRIEEMDENELRTLLGIVEAGSGSGT